MCPAGAYWLLTPKLADPDRMANERKYGDEEVEEIFDLAASRGELGRPHVSDEGGLTLAELQEVGLEVGMEPGRIAEAALAVDARREVLPRRTYMGVPAIARFFHVFVLSVARRSEHADGQYGDEAKDCGC